MLVACKGPVDPSEIDADGDGVFADVDCDDLDPQVNPGILEQPYDGVDNDCSPATADDDLDGDGLIRADDCDDRDPLRPSPEVPYDGIDNDCVPSTPDDDLDEDGHGIAADCDDGDPAVSPDAAEIFYDGIDNDCDPLNTVDDDMDEDGVGLAEDCDDTDFFARAPLAWFVDCDQDGVAPGIDGSIVACELPPAPSACADGTWTLTEPIGPAYDVANTTVDCVDTDPDVFPGQTVPTDVPIAGAVGGAYDRDCDGLETSEPDAVFVCEVVPAVPTGFVCVHTPGWDGAIPACGDSGAVLTGCTLLGDGPTDCEGATSTDVLRACL